MQALVNLGLRQPQLQVLGLVFGVGQLPGLVDVHIGVHLVGQQHHLAQGAGGVAHFVVAGNGRRLGLQRAQQGEAVGIGVAQLACKPLADEPGAAAGDVHELAHQVAVDAGHEVGGVEVHVFVLAVELGGQVVAQPFGVHAQAQVLQRVEAGAPALAHFFAVVDGQEAVDEHRIGCFAATEMQHGRPEQGVEIGDVFADEVILLGGGVGHKFFIAACLAAGGQRAAFVEIVFQRGQVADGRIQPHIEILARRIGNLDAEIGRIAADVPVAQAARLHAVFVGGFGKPFLDLVQHFGLQGAFAVRPLLQKLGAARVAQREEVVLRLFHHRRGPGEGGVRVFQLGGGVHRAAAFAAVAVLVFGTALGAGALDEAVGQEHLLFGVEKLLDGLGGDQPVGLEGAVDVLGQLVVFGAVGAVPVVKGDVEAVQVGLAPGGDVGHKLLGRDARLFGGNHDGRAVRIVGTHKMHLVPLHALKTHPSVGLDVFHDVANVEVAVGVGQGGGNEQAALAHGSGCVW